MLLRQLNKGLNLKTKALMPDYFVSASSFIPGLKTGYLKIRHRADEQKSYRQWFCK